MKFVLGPKKVARRIRLWAMHSTGPREEACKKSLPRSVLIEIVSKTGKVMLEWGLMGSALLHFVSVASSTTESFTKNAISKSRRISSKP